MKHVLIILAILCLPAMVCAAQDQAADDALDYGQLEKRIAGLTVQNLAGEAVALESIWEQRRVVLAFLRHFG